MALSQEAYDLYYPELPKGGALIVEEDLVKLKADHSDIKLWRVPATRFAEELGNRLFTNLVALGFLTAVTGVVTADAMKKALPGLVPDRFLKINQKAFEKGYDYGVEAVKAAGAKS
jgi:2-oxoglutarate ferredoxin oxidoreductase subunit gamma